jgi:hypothetical protein
MGQSLLAAETKPIADWSGHNKRPRHCEAGAKLPNGGKVLPLTKKSGPARQKSLSLITAYLREYGAKILES